MTACARLGCPRDERDPPFDDLIVKLDVLLYVSFGSFTTDAFSTRADQCPLLLQKMG